MRNSGRARRGDREHTFRDRKGEGIKDDIVKALLERLPTWEFKRTESIGAAVSNGKDEES